MRILQHRQTLGVLASADRQLDGVGAGRLEDRQPAAPDAESAFAFADAVGTDANLRRVERAGAVGYTLRRRVAQIPEHAVQTRRWRPRESANRLPFRVLDGD